MLENMGYVHDFLSCVTLSGFDFSLELLCCLLICESERKGIAEVGNIVGRLELLNSST